MPGLCLETIASLAPRILPNPNHGNECRCYLHVDRSLETRRKSQWALRSSCQVIDTCSCDSVWMTYGSNEVISTEAVSSDGCVDRALTWCDLMKIDKNVKAELCDLQRWVRNQTHD